MKYYLNDELYLAIVSNKHPKAKFLFRIGARIRYKYKFRDCMAKADDEMKEIIGENPDACPSGSLLD